jgi:hypothetical protein
MQLEEITLALFATCNSLRVLAYLPQIHKAAVDKNGASAISRATWSLFLLAHASTIAYALVNRSDLWLALCFAGNALCCVVILAIAWWKDRAAHHLHATSSQFTTSNRWSCGRGVRAAVGRCATSIATSRARSSCK